MEENKEMRALIDAMKKMVREYEAGNSHPIDLQRVRLRLEELDASRMNK